MKTDFHQAKWEGGLSDLSAVSLDAEHQEIFEKAVAGCAGTPVWQRRIRTEVREFVALSMVSGRIVTAMVDARDDLRIMFELRVPVPTLPDPDGELVVEDRALLVLTYPEESLFSPRPGFSFVNLLQPNHLFLANAAPSDPALPLQGLGQAICLGPEIAAGTPVKEIVLRTFGALTMQSVQLDERDAAGVMNPAAAAWWLQNRHRMPLTREGFLEYEPSDQS